MFLKYLFVFQISKGEHAVKLGHSSLPPPFLKFFWYHYATFSIPFINSVESCNVSSFIGCLLDLAKIDDEASDESVNC